MRELALIDRWRNRTIPNHAGVIHEVGRCGRSNLIKVCILVIARFRGDRLESEVSLSGRLALMQKT